MVNTKFRSLARVKGAPSPKSAALRVGELTRGWGHPHRIPHPSSGLRRHATTATRGPWRRASAPAGALVGRATPRCAPRRARRFVGRDEASARAMPRPPTSGAATWVAGLACEENCIESRRDGSASAPPDEAHDRPRVRRSPGRVQQLLDGDRVVEVRSESLAGLNRPSQPPVGPGDIP